MRVRILANISFALAGLLAALEQSRVAIQAYSDAAHKVRLQPDDYPVHCRIVHMDAGLADAMAAGEQIASRGINPAPYRIRPACAASALAATIAAHTTRFCRTRLAAADTPVRLCSVGPGDSKDSILNRRSARLAGKTGSAAPIACRFAIPSPYPAFEPSKHVVIGSRHSEGPHS